MATMYVIQYEYRDCDYYTNFEPVEADHKEGESWDYKFYTNKEDAEVVCAKHNQEMLDRHKAKWEAKEDQRKADYKKALEGYATRLVEHRALVAAGLREEGTEPKVPAFHEAEYELPKSTEGTWSVEEVEVEII